MYVCCKEIGMKKETILERHVCRHKWDVQKVYTKNNTMSVYMSTIIIQDDLPCSCHQKSNQMGEFHFDKSYCIDIQRYWQMLTHVAKLSRSSKGYLTDAEYNLQKDPTNECNTKWLIIACIVLLSAKENDVSYLVTTSMFSCHL